MLELFKVVILGIVEGITEWLPISSTGHMLLFDLFLKLKSPDDFKTMFFVVIQLGAILAVVMVYWSQLWPWKRAENGQITTSRSTIRLWGKVLVATLPAAVVGFALDDFIDAHMHKPVIIALALIIFGIWFILIEDWNKKRRPAIRKLSQITYRDALLIGAFQMLALVPGVSRSGATIIGMLVMGVSRGLAARFSFFMSIPVMFGASFLKLVKFGFHFTGFQVVELFIGMVVAFVVSVLVIKFLMEYIKKHDFKVFGWYRIALGILVLLVFGLRAIF